MTYHFPDAFYGTNNKIRETLNSLILNSPQEWQTSVALPFVRIEGTTVEWDEMKFDVRLLQRVPYEGASIFMFLVMTCNLTCAFLNRYLSHADFASQAA